VFSEQTTDTTTASTTFVTLLTANITNTVNSNLLIQATVSSANDTINTTNYFRITVDGTPIRGFSERYSTAGTTKSASLVSKQSITAGAHTVLLQWRVSGGTASVAPVTSPDAQHASILLSEVTV
jgi:hypothetical protein